MRGLRGLAGVSLAFVAWVSTSTAAPDAVRLAPATPGAVRFTVTVPAPGLSVTDVASGMMHLRLDGYELEAAGGAPALPVRVVNVAIPPLGDVHLTSAASELTDRGGVLLEPQPTHDIKGVRHDVRLPSAYGARGSASVTGAELVAVTWLRNQRIARIAIRPAAYEPAARHLTIARRVDVELQVVSVGDLGPPAEADDPFEPVYAKSLVNYAQGKLWRRPQMPAFIAAARRLGLDPKRISVLTAPPDTSVFVGRAWVRIAITQPGFYALNYSELRQTALFNGAGAPFDSLRMFTLPGFPLLPEGSYCDSCDLHEVGLGVIDVGNDGVMSDNTDAIYFFAQGVNGWGNDYDATLPDTVYINHPYELKNYFYLTIATPTLPVGGTPARITTRPATPVPASGATVVTEFADRAHFEQDHEYQPDATSLGSTLFWEKWFWLTLQAGGSFSTTFDVPGADTTQAARLRMRSWGLSDNELFNNCPPGTPDHFLDATLNGTAFTRQAWNSFVAILGGQSTLDTTGTFLRRTNNRLSLSIPVVSVSGCPGRVDEMGFAWFDIFYQHLLQPSQDQLEIRSPAAAGLYHYDAGPFASPTQARAFDVSDPLHPVELMISGSAYTPVAGGFQLSFEDAQAASRRYELLPDSLITIARVPGTAIVDAPFTSLDNLRSRTNGADYLVIYYDGFKQAADALAAARAQRLPLTDKPAPYVTKAIPISALYDQFSGGRTDPSAIRNFLRAAFYNWQLRPRFVTLLGDASYDFKNILGAAPPGAPGTLLPSFENGFDFNQAVFHQFATDDWIMNVNDPTGYLADFYGGRLPADDATTALEVVQNKILPYETSAPLGEYRNKIMLIADDDMQGADCDPIGWGHVAQTTALDTLATPAHFDRAYVYLHTYPTGPGATKPGARADILKNVNDGVTIFNYVGHGSPFKITDESVFLDSDAGTLTNGLRMPLFVSASCDVGKFDNPRVQSLGELLVLAPKGGSIGVISATELALSDENSTLNRNIYDQLFQRGDVALGDDVLKGAGQYHMPISAALLSAKLVGPNPNSLNNAKYEYMGDAATQLNAPKLWADVSVFDLQGNPATEIKRGQTLEFRGHVLDAPGGTGIPFNGVASLLIEDSSPLDRTGFNPYPGCRSFYNDTAYRFVAGPIYHGDVSVASGGFDGRFVVPVDAALGAYGRIRAYLNGSEAGSTTGEDGAGSTKLQVSDGAPNANDTQGPRITLSFVGGATAVRADAVLRVDLFDESGIMTTGHSLLNSIVVTIDDNTTSRVDITSSFRYAADSYQSGTADFPLPGLSPGHHKIRVSAADNLASGINASIHRSATTLEFDVVDSPALNVARAYLFPNPTRSSGPGAGGSFVVDAPGDSVNTLIRVYTISGKLIRVLKNFGSLGQVQIPWDGRDGDGARLANGTYLFKVFVYHRDDDGSSSPTERAVSEGRFVIVHP